MKAEKLRSLLQEIDNLKHESYTSPAFKEWYDKSERCLLELFGSNSTYLEHFRAILFTPLFLSCCRGEKQFDEAFERGLEEARRLILLCLKEIETQA